MQTVLFFPGTVAALGVIFAQQATSLIGNSSLLLPIAIGIIILVAGLNTLGSKTGGSIQTVSTACKLIPLILIMVFGFIKGSGENAIISPLVGESISMGNVLGQVLIAILFAYDGWINVGALAGEMKNPEKDLPKAIVGGLALVMAVYLVINLAYLWVLPASDLAKYSAPAAAVAEAIFGSVGGKIITLGILISVFGTLNGFILTGSRVTYTLANEKTLPGYKSLSKLNSSQVPANSIILIAIISSIYALSGQFNLLTDLAVFAIWIFYVLTFIGVIKLRKEQPNLYRPYKVPLYPIIPLIAIFSGLFVVINQLFFSGIKTTMISVGGLLITAIGIPVYNYMIKNKLK
ncbi:amino acid permease, partial [Clostridium sp. CCUG 7971]|uniref:APC family permease n=1 Tax=Clostridium sp. CCUG 7971 TaxID=2811414 RepID=UPI001ABB26FD